MGWIARNIFNNEYYGKKYGSIYDCQNYIDKHIDLDKIWEEYFIRNDIRSDLHKAFYKLNYGNIVKCYNTEQNRFCTGFDF